jgi:hypothetical protein
MKVDRNKLIKAVLQQYLGSEDFNGLPVRQLLQAGAQVDELATLVAELVAAGYIGVSHSDFVANPHILSFEHASPQEQAALIASGKLSGACLYPTRPLLSASVNPADYAATPFRMMLALGYPQLGVILCYPSVLQHYRIDPRYDYATDDICGHLVVSDAFYDNGNMPESDEIMLKRFGFAVTSSGLRAVAVYLRDLTQLSDQHQQIWAARQISGEEIERDNYYLHPEYMRSQQGARTSRSLTTAFMHELNGINEVCSALYGRRLFKSDWIEGLDRLPEFTMMLSPTSSEYDEFIHLLDKLLSDNINKDFFKGRCELEAEQQRGDGKIVVSQKGTLQLLTEFLTTEYPDDPQIIDTIVGPLRNVRKQRQRPAHAIRANKYDPTLWNDQRKLLQLCHTGLRALRELLFRSPGFQPLAETARRLAMPVSAE